LVPRSAEVDLLVEFQRRAHHYPETTPALDEVVDWLALMQHYGAPTRLLDWTYAPYVALYFALEDASSKSDSALWAIELDWLIESSQTALRKHEPELASITDFRARCEYINRMVLAETNPNIVILANPFRMNQRLTAQQGTFLCSLSHIEEFYFSLLRMMASPATPAKPVVRKLLIMPEARIGLLKELKRTNITGASLFPGLDGFARSLRVNLEIELDATKHQIEG
jgi:hypothetical protein